MHNKDVKPNELESQQAYPGHSNCPLCKEEKEYNEEHEGETLDDIVDEIQDLLKRLKEKYC